MASRHLTAPCLTTTKFGDSVERHQTPDLRTCKVWVHTYVGQERAWQKVDSVQPLTSAWQSVEANVPRKADHCQYIEASAAQNPIAEAGADKGRFPDIRVKSAQIRARTLMGFRRRFRCMQLLLE